MEKAASRNGVGALGLVCGISIVGVVSAELLEDCGLKLFDLVLIVEGTGDSFLGRITEMKREEKKLMGVCEVLGTLAPDGRLSRSWMPIRVGSDIRLPSDEQLRQVLSPSGHSLRIGTILGRDVPVYLDALEIV